VQFESAKIKGTKIILHVKSPTFRAAKLKGFTVLTAVIFLLLVKDGIITAIYMCEQCAAM